MAQARCPSWCVTDHAAFDGEEAGLHMGTPVQLAGGLTAQLC